MVRKSMGVPPPNGWDDWLAECRAWSAEHGYTAYTLPGVLAEAWRALEPQNPVKFSRSVVNRYIRGQVWANEMVDAITRAFVGAMSTDHPRPVLRTPEQREWCALGVLLSEIAPGTFGDNLARVRQLVALSDDRRRRNRK